MDSESGKRSPVWRATFVILGLLLVLALLASAATYWLLATESGARTILPILAQRSDGSVSLNGVHGKLIGPLRIESVAIEQPNERVQLSDLRVEWKPAALLRQRLLHLTALQIGHVAVTTKIDRAPEPETGMPQELSLPFALRIDAAGFDGGEIRRGPATLLELGPLAFSLRFADQRYELDLQRFGARPQFNDGTARTGLNGSLALSAQRPFSLTGRFELDSEASVDQRELAARGAILLTGSLEELRVALDLKLNQAPIIGAAVLHPFAARILGSARLETQALDLAEFDAALPQTSLDILLTSSADGSGALRLRNATPGVVSDNKLPLRTFDLTFEETSEGFNFDRIHAQLGSAARPGRPSGPAGVLTGSGRYVNGALTLDLHTDDLNLQRIDPGLRATKLAGRIGLRHADGRQTFSLNLSEPVGKRRIVLAAEGALGDAVLEINRAELQAGDGRMGASARLALDGTQAFQAEGSFTRFNLHDFGRFEQVPEMNLNGKFSLSGTRAPQLRADLDFDIANSRLAGQPLHGNGKARVRGERLEVDQILLTSGANRIEAQGRLAEGDATLTFSLQAPKLAQLGAEFGGALQAKGSVSGTLADPLVNLEWSATRARLPGDTRIESMQGQAEIRMNRAAPFMLGTVQATLKARGMQREQQQLDSVAARIRFAPRPGAPLELDIDAQGLSAGDTKFTRATVNASGTTARHTVDAVLRESSQTWTLRASGGLSAIDVDPRWKGRLDTFEARGQLNARSVSAASLEIGSTRSSVEDLRLELEGGRIVLERLVRDAQGVETRGRIEQLRIAQFLRFADPAPPLETDLQIGAEWDLRYTDKLDGRIALQRESGDVTVLGTTPVTLGLDTLRASLQAKDGRATLRVQAEGRRMGRVTVNANTQLGSADSAFAIVQSAPISGNVDVDIPSLAWVSPLVAPTVAIDGRVRGEVRLAGTLGDPQVSGTINGDALRVAHAEFGLDLRQGVLRSEFKGDQLLLQDLTFEGQQGRISLTGPIDLGREREARLLLRAERFAVLNRPDRRLVLTGESRVIWQKERARISGAFTVESGVFDIGQADRPRLGDDVVIVGQKDHQEAPALGAAIDVTVRLGGNVIIQGRGLDATLAGTVRLLSEVGSPLRAEGTVRVAKGTFSAYGRALAIEQGLLRFTGPLNNPALDILAMRRGQEVEAGVSVRGTVLAPRVTLVSEPSVPDAEKLSWLVLGRSLAAAGEDEIGSLQDAAGALLAQSAAAGVQSRIASALGLDTFKVGTTQDNLQQRIVTLGKQVSSRLYVGFEQGLDTAGSVLHLRYMLNPSLSLEAQAGTRSALSLFYNITFD